MIYQLKMVIFHSYVRYGPTHSYKWNYITPITKVIYIYIIIIPLITVSWAITVGFGESSPNSRTFQVSEI